MNSFKPGLNKDEAQNMSLMDLLCQTLGISPEEVWVKDLGFRAWGLGFRVWEQGNRLWEYPRKRYGSRI